MAKKPKVNFADAISTEATDFINAAPDAPAKPKKAAKEKTVRVNFELDAGIHKRLKALAVELDTTVTNLLTEASNRLINRS